jgi:two-component system sensor histidine kinase/response regulator
MSPTPKPGPDAATVLIVDDVADNRRLLGRLVSSLGHTVIEAADGPAALSLAPQADLILLDVMMPGMDGFEVCRRLRGSPATRFTPIVLVTALTEREHRITGQEVGADDFLTKPVDRAEVTARVTSLLRLQRQRAELERLKDEWTAMLVHDLRSPLQAIQGFAELLQTPGDGVEQALFVDRILDGTRRMRGLVDAVLDVSRLEAGHVEIVRQPVPVGDLLKAATDEAAALAKGRRLHLKRAWPDDLPVCSADGRKLRQVLANLLDNACKFAAAEIMVAATCKAGTVTITVSNDGDTVAPDQMAALFERWQQTDAGRKLGVGSGLGLAIVKALVEAHGGTVAAEARPGGGLAIRVLLPLSAG